MPEKYPGLTERVDALGIDSANISRIKVCRPDGAYDIENVPGKQISVKVFAGIADKRLRIGKEEAQNGIDAFGMALVGEAVQERGKHPNIDFLMDIADGKIKSAYLDITGHTMPVPFSRELIEDIVTEHPTPVHIYDEAGIRQTARYQADAFKWVPGKGFQNYFAVKACPNPMIMDILMQEGMGADCSSGPELLMAERIGLLGENIMFTSNNTPVDEFQKAVRMGAVVNLDDITHIDTLEHHAGIPELICFRFNPGEERTGNAIIGNPVEAKYGLTREQLFEAYGIMKKKGAKRFGLHTMVASNELNPEYFVETGRMLLDLVAELSEEHGITFEFVNLGGGVGTPYRPGEKPVDLDFVSKGIHEIYREKIEGNGLPPLRVVMECGRMVTGPHGFLAARVRHVTEKHRNYAGLDACMANLMRPALYGAYHHITVLGKEDALMTVKYDVTGSLCENNDKFAINRFMPELEPGDIILLHNAGAHGYAMGFQYNGKLRSAEVLVKPDRSFEQIRRAETFEDYAATMRWPDRK